MEGGEGLEGELVLSFQLQHLLQWEERGFAALFPLALQVIFPILQKHEVCGQPPASVNGSSSIDPL